MVAPTISPVELPERRAVQGRKIGVGILVLLVLYGVGFVAGGEFGAFMLAGATALPFAGLALLAYLGLDRVWARVAALIALLGLAGVYALYGLVLAILGLAGASATNPRAFHLSGGQWGQLALIVLGFMAAFVAGGLMGIPALRRRLARVLPIDPDSFVHTVALMTVAVLTLIGFVPLLVLAAPPLLSAVTSLTSGGQDLLGDRGGGGALRDQLSGLIWTIPCAVLAVGYGVRRNLRAALIRLGLVRPTVRQVAAALMLAVVAVVLSRLLDLGITWLWGTMGWPRTDDAAFGSLMAYALSPLGAAVVGVSAGLGEELAVRGALQPRLGILLSNVFFTSLHAFQYNWDGLLSVFLLGLALGLIRRRSNTTTSAIVHGTYDFLLVMVTVLQVPWFT